MTTRLFALALAPLLACGEAKQDAAPDTGGGAPVDAVDAAGGDGDAEGDVQAPDAADSAPEDTSTTQDTGADAADATPPEDAGSDTADTADASEPDADAAEDTGPPPPAAPRGFRVSSLELLSPELCYDLDGNGTCDPVNVFVNAIVNGELTHEEEPLDVVGVLSPFQVPTNEASLELGAASCVRGAGGVLDIVHCELVQTDDQAPAVFDQVFTKDTGGCLAKPLILAPCFSTASQASLSLTLLDIPFKFLEARVAGRFDDPVAFSAIGDGHIRAFMPQSVAAGVLVEIPGQGYVKLGELLTQAQKTTVSGKAGWVFEFQYEAVQVPLEAP